MHPEVLKRVALAAALCMGVFSLLLGAAPFDKKPRAVINESNGLKVEVQELQPFTRIAYVPAAADLSTIRFEKARTVKVSTQVTFTTPLDYCEELTLFRDPGGSMQCPYGETGAPATAVEVTYSFRGPSLASDEYGQTYSVFHVYFRPDDLAPTVRNLLASRELSRHEAAGYFDVRTYREQRHQVVIDEDHSKLCDRTLSADVWAHTDRDCHDSVMYKTVTVPSDYVTVRVDPVSRP